MINLKLFEALRAVIMSGGVTEAGKLLNRSQPAVSRMIADLEAYVGVKLFERRNSRLVPTSEALSLYQEVQTIFKEVHRLERYARNLNAPANAHLIIAVAPLFAQQFVPALLAKVRRRYPDLHFSLHIRNPTAVTSMVASGEADIGFSGISYLSEQLNEQIFYEAELVCAMPADHILTHKQFVTPSDLDGEDFIGFNHEVTPVTITGDVLEDMGARPAVWIETQQSQAVHGLVAAGLGLALIEPIAALNFPSTSLAIRRFHPTIHTTMKILFSSSRNKSRIVQHIVQEAKEEIAHFIGIIEQRLNDYPRDV